MSKYTTQIRFIIEMNSDEGLPITQRIEQALPAIFNFNYPIWSNEYKRTLEKKILMHYFNKEICCETVGLWKLYLEERLNLIMPYYNEIYKTVAIDYEWLEDIDVVEHYEGNKNIVGKIKDSSVGTIIDSSRGKVTDSGQDTTTSSNNETNTLTGTKTSKDLKSDLPQANYQGLDYGTELHDTTSTDNNTTTHEATSNSTIDKNNVTDTTSNSNTDTSSSSNTDTTNTTNDNFIRSHKGLNGSRSRQQLNLEYRQSLINIDKMVIEELKDLFMMIY